MQTNRPVWLARICLLACLTLMAIENRACPTHYSYLSLQCYNERLLICLFNSLQLALFIDLNSSRLGPSDSLVSQSSILKLSLNDRPSHCLLNGFFLVLRIISSWLLKSCSTSTSLVALFDIRNILLFFITLSTMDFLMLSHSTFSFYESVSI